MIFSELISQDYQDKLHTAWEHFINDLPYDYSFVRPEVYASWQRSKSNHINPHAVITSLLSREELNIKLNKNEEIINIVQPYVKQIYSVVKGTNTYIMVSDSDGYIMAVVGDSDIIKQGVTLSKLTLGACRSEISAGTNAIGTALYLQKPIQLFGEEHYCDWNKVYVCACAPFFDETHRMLGAINITLLKEHAHPHTLGLIQCAADSITREIGLKRSLESIETLNKQRALMLENMTSGVLMLSLKGRVSQINTKALNMLGVTYEEIIGQNIFDLINFDGNKVVGDSYSLLLKERYNVELTLTLIAKSAIPKRYNISIDHILDAKKNITAILMRINTPEVIQSLVKKIEGYHAKYTFDDIIGTSPAMQKVKKECEKVAQNQSNVLIIGQSGTGKELIAQSIHNASSVAKGPFVAINCGALPKNLVESELFGYERGAFTGASKDGRPGKFELANGGTIFLDEIGDMPLDVQATLLRVIQTKEVVRIGGRYPKPINVRIIAATNKDLEKEVEDKMFRGDLYYRLNVFTIAPPALRERSSTDIIDLTNYFINAYNNNKGRHIKISPDVYPALCGYSWPGNVRQLENVIERAVNLADDDLITLEHLPQCLVQYMDKKSFGESVTNEHTKMVASTYIETVAPQPSSIVSANSIRGHEKEILISALVACNGNVTATAKYLDMNKRTLYRRIEKYNIDPSEYRGL